MVFSSLVFLLLFLPVTLAMYFLVPKRAKNAVLFFMSLVFYAWGEPVYIAIMLFSTVFDYCNGLALEKLKEKNEPKKQKAVLILSVVVNLGLLCFFKYTDFALTTVNSAFNTSLQPLSIALPIGISFYTFQTLSYTIDVYRNRVKAQHNIISFGMYICMFPQLIAGPIVRYADIEKQLDINSRPFNSDKASNGMLRFMLGIGKKVLLANTVGMLWEEISALGGVSSACTSYLGTAAFMLQIYFDFSGYSDMAIGLAKILGFDLKENFDYPYMSKSVTEFWRRWHISLGVWFREYVYIPLGGNRKGLPRQILNLFIVWFLTGLWHGAGWNFILWGLYFFVLLVIEKLFLLRLLDRLPKLIGHIYTLLCVFFSWVIFANDDITVLSEYVKSLFFKYGFCSADARFYLMNFLAVFIAGILLSTPYPKKVFKLLLSRVKSEKARFALKLALCVIVFAASFICIVSSGYNPFLYFRF